METKPYGKKLLWLVGTIFLGAIGSGFWEALLKPSLLWVGTFVLDIATLGLNSLKDGIYIDAAKSNCERASVTLLLFMTGGMVGISLSLLFIPMYIKKKWEQMKCEEGQTKKGEKSWLSSAILIICSSVLMIQAFRISYVIQAANHVNQMIRIVSPYVPHERILVFESRFAQVKTRSDYLNLVTELHQIAKKNAANIPKFDVY